jgi:hypothetical protein
MTSKKKATPKQPKKTKKPEPLFVLFGMDEKEQPRGAWFKYQDEALLMRMATGLGLRMATARTANHVALVSQFPQGDVNGTGQGSTRRLKRTVRETARSGRRRSGPDLANASEILGRHQAGRSGGCSAISRRRLLAREGHQAPRSEFSSGLERFPRRRVYSSSQLSRLAEPRSELNNRSSEGSGRSVGPSFRFAQADRRMS